MKRIQHRDTSLPVFYERYPKNGCVPVACALFYADGDEDLAEIVFNDLTDHLAAWLGDIPAHDLLVDWEKRRIDRRIEDRFSDGDPVLLPYPP